MSVPVGEHGAFHPAAFNEDLVSSLRDPEVMIVQQGVQGANGRAADFLRILVDSGAAMCRRRLQIYLIRSK